MARSGQNYEHSDARAKRTSRVAILHMFALKNRSIQLLTLLIGGFATDWIKNMIFLIVRVHGHYISMNRPDNYLHSNRKGKRINTVGSGYISHISGPFADEDDSYKRHNAVCGACKSGGQNSLVWRVFVTTARHVLFDQEESAASEIVLFDHHDDSLGSVTLSGGRSLKADADRDESLVFFYTHDKTTADKLEQVLWRNRQLRLGFTIQQPNDKMYTFLTFLNTLLLKFLRMMPDIKEENIDEFVNMFVHLRRLFHQVAGKAHRDFRKVEIGTPAVLLSHPHGRKLYISVGTFSDDQGQFYHEKCLYNTRSCPGSSGGFVLNVKQLTHLWPVNEILCQSNTHSGISQTGSGIAHPCFFTYLWVAFLNAFLAR